MRLDYMTAGELAAHCQKLKAQVFRSGVMPPAPSTDPRQADEMLEHVIKLYALDPDYAIFSARLHATLQPAVMGDLMDRLLEAVKTPRTSTPRAVD